MYKFFEGYVIGEYEGCLFEARAKFEINVDKQDLLKSGWIKKICDVECDNACIDCNAIKIEHIRNIRYITHKFSIKNRKIKDICNISNRCLKYECGICGIEASDIQLKKLSENKDINSRLIHYCNGLKKDWFSNFEESLNKRSLPLIEYHVKNRQIEMGDGRHRFCIMKRHLDRYGEELRIPVEVSISI